jgi:hypothetical protein
MNPDDFTYENLLTFVDEGEIISLMEQMDMIMLVNMSEQPAVLNILEAFLDRIFPRLAARKRFFVDLSDCSHISRSCMGLLAGLSLEDALHAGVWAGNRFIRTGMVEPNNFLQE